MTTMRPGWREQAELIASTLRSGSGSGVVGIYVHGSAALGGWTPASDLDVLVTVDATTQDWRMVGRELLAELAPSPVVELSIVSVVAASEAEAPWPFLLHLNHRERRIVVGDGAGDPDLLMHYVVARHSGIAILGPAAEAAFGTVPRASVLAYLRDELTWALTEADQRYAVLNACRALAYYSDGVVLSKLAGGEWALARGYDPALINSALAAQRAGRDLGGANPTARAFVEQCGAQLDSPAPSDHSRG